MAIIKQDFADATPEFNYINQKYLDTALGKFYVAKGQSSVADWVSLN